MPPPFIAEKVSTSVWLTQIVERLVIDEPESTHRLVVDTIKLFRPPVRVREDP